MKERIDIEQWDRKDHFEFFNQFDEPFYGVCVNIECTSAYRFCKENKYSFFLYYLYQCLVASHRHEAFRLRVEGSEVFRYDRIDGGSTIGRADGTFGFGDFMYKDTFAEFHQEACKVMEKVRSEKGLRRSGAGNVVRFSALPWIDFTALSHARSFGFKDSCPKISFGKVTSKEGHMIMPVSIHVHHALVDGFHLGQFIDTYQELMNGQKV